MVSDAERILTDRNRRVRAAEPVPGILGSVFLHALFLLFIIGLLASRNPEKPEKLLPYVPVDVVELGRQTTAPPAPVRAPVPQQKAQRGPAAAPRPQTVSPHGTRVPKDELEVRLRTLARLRQPDSNLTIENDGASDITSSNGAAAGPVAYSVRDYIRAQILRRWNLNIAELKGRTLVIPLHVMLTGKGAIIKVEIRNPGRYATDAVYRDIAISARNAVLLSAPFKLPEHAPRDGIDFDLSLNPRDALR
jgi:hypothetical protein